MSRLIACTLFATLAVVSPALAQTTQIRVLRPEVRLAPAPDNLPRFGFESFNIQGYGERVTRVRHFGLAADMGLEPGDVIVRMNHIPLTYHGAWSDALREALINHDGRVRLTIRDVRTGALVQRQVFVGGDPWGPVTPKSHNHAGHHHDDHDVHYSERDNRNRGERRRGNGGNFGPSVEHHHSSSN